MATGTITVKGTPVPKQYIGVLLASSLITWSVSIGFWYTASSYITSHTSTSSPAIASAIITSILTCTILSIRFHLTWKQWINLWVYTTPWLLTSIVLFPQLPHIPILA